MKMGHLHKTQRNFINQERRKKTSPKNSHTAAKKLEMETHKFHKTLVQFRSGQICKGRRNTGDETQEIIAGDEHFGDV